MATPAVFLRALLLLASAMKICQGQCEQGYDKYGNSCTYKGNCGRWSSCPYGFYCLDTQWGSRCGYCLTGYQYNGRTSQCEDFDECRQYSWPCPNENCTNTAGSYICTCWNGYERDATGSCADINECDSRPCQHGTCYHRVNYFWCTCNAGFTGTLCNEDINECELSPCQQGSCQNAPGSFWCDCNTGYTGKLCQFDVNECDSRPCQHGTCHNTWGSYQCNCSSGYTGSVCDTDINECNSSPCQHGTCSNTQGGFQCNCSAGYIGTLCNIETPDLYIDSSVPPNATGERMKAMFSSEEQYTQPDITWTCTVEATDCSTVNVTVSLNITNGDWYPLSYFSLPGRESLGQHGDAFMQATYTTPFNVKLHRAQWSTLRFAYITVRGNFSLTMVCGRGASASTPTDACNHCKSSPCAANTTCLDVRDDFRCLCPEGFINALDSHTCVEKPDLQFDHQNEHQASGLEVRAMFSSSTSAPEPTQNWTCVVEAVDCRSQEVTLQVNVSNGHNASSLVSFTDNVPVGDSSSSKNATSQTAVDHYLAKQGTTPFHFTVGTPQPVYLVIQALSNVTVTCGRKLAVSLVTSRCAADAMRRQSDSTAAIPAIVGGVAALVVIAVIVVVVIFKRKSMADGKKARGDNSVSFNDLRQRENQQESRPPAAAQRSLTSGSATHQGAGAVYAVVNKPARGKGGKASRVAPPVYAAVNKATGASNSTPTVRASSDQAYSLASNDNPPPYELATACGPDMKAAAASLTAAQGTPQTAEGPTDYDVLGQTRGSTKAGRDVTYGHLGEVVGDDDVDYGYDHTGTQSTGGVINSVYDTARAPSDGHGDLGDDDTADGAYDTTKLGQGQRREVVGSDYDKMDQTYVNSAFSMQPRK